MTISGLSTEEAGLLAHLAAGGKEIFTIDDAYTYWEHDPNTPFRLRNLEKKGWLERLERGKYLIVPLEAGPSREWTENAFVIAAHLVQPAAVAYWSALHHWNLTEQVPRLTYVQTTARKFRLLAGGERCVCELQDELDVGQSLLSHHLRALKDAGLVTDRRDGRWIHYSLNRELLEEIEDFLREARTAVRRVRLSAACCD